MRHSGQGPIRTRQRPKLRVHYCIFQGDDNGFLGWSRDDGGRKGRWDTLLDTALKCIMMDGGWERDAQVSIFAGPDVLHVNGFVQSQVMQIVGTKPDGRPAYLPATMQSWEDTLWRHFGQNTTGLQWHLDRDRPDAGQGRAQDKLLRRLEEFLLQAQTDCCAMALDYRDADSSYDRLKAKGVNRELRCGKVFLLLGGAHGFDGRNDSDNVLFNGILKCFMDRLGAGRVLRVNLCEDPNDIAKFTAVKVAAFLSVEHTRGVLRNAVAGLEALCSTNPSRPCVPRHVAGEAAAPKPAPWARPVQVTHVEIGVQTEEVALEPAGSLDSCADLESDGLDQGLESYVCQQDTQECIEVEAAVQPHVTESPPDQDTRESDVFDHNWQNVLQVADIGKPELADQVDALHDPPHEPEPSCFAAPSSEAGGDHDVEAEKSKELFPVTSESSTRDGERDCHLSDTCRLDCCDPKPLFANLSEGDSFPDLNPAKSVVHKARKAIAWGPAKRRITVTSPLIQTMTLPSKPALLTEEPAMLDPHTHTPSAELPPQPPEQVQQLCSSGQRPSPSPCGAATAALNSTQNGHVPSSVLSSLRHVVRELSFRRPRSFLLLAEKEFHRLAGAEAGSHISFPQMAPPFDTVLSELGHVLGLEVSKDGFRLKAAMDAPPLAAFVPQTWLGTVPGDWNSTKPSIGVVNLACEGDFSEYVACRAPSSTCSSVKQTIRDKADWMQVPKLSHHQWILLKKECYSPTDSAGDGVVITFQLSGRSNHLDAGLAIALGDHTMSIQDDAFLSQLRGSRARKSADEGSFFLTMTPTDKLWELKGGLLAESWEPTTFQWKPDRAHLHPTVWIACSHSSQGFLIEVGIRDFPSASLITHLLPATPSLIALRMLPAQYCVRTLGSQPQLDCRVRIERGLLRDRAGLDHILLPNSDIPEAADLASLAGQRLAVCSAEVASTLRQQATAGVQNRVLADC